MKAVRFTRDALSDLARHAGERRRLMAKIEAYATTGAGDVKRLSDGVTARLRAGSWRVLFREDGDTILIVRIGPRGSVYDDLE